MTTHTPTTSRIDFQYRKWIFAAAAVIILCTQFQIMQMTQQDSAKAEKANWNDAETDALLEYLISCRSKLAGTTVKTDRFNEAAAHLHTKKLKTHGPMKTGAHCKNKWNLKLGIHWDPVVGANIQGTAAEEAWSDYVGRPLNSSMKQFKNWMEILHQDAANFDAVSVLRMERQLIIWLRWQPLALPQRASQCQVPLPDVAGSSTGGAGSSTGGVGASTSGDPGDDGISSWDIPPLRIPTPVASTSLAAAPPVSSSGKRSHTDMIFNTAPPSLTSSTPMSEGGSNGGGGSNKTRATSSKKAIKEAASTTALMNLQGTDQPFIRLYHDIFHDH
ncbi:hypothetical protein DFH29DRAFT_997400 [Suillus ampliporus]|nr:hypothetical protein DFH29DRAFT_997400 [Suillus ampliporus]